MDRFNCVIMGCSISRLTCKVLDLVPDLTFACSSLAPLRYPR